jgi:hypothetical protein
MQALLSFFRKGMPMADAGYLILIIVLFAISGLAVWLIHHL